MAFEMMAEMEENLRRMKENLDNVEENLDNVEENLERQQAKLQEEAIQNMEEKLSLEGVSSSDLDPSLWVPYSDWKEKIRNSVDSSLEIFLSEMRIAISKAKVKKDNANHYSSSNYSS